jgi:hypothetical protein
MRAFKNRRTKKALVKRPANRAVLNVVLFEQRINPADYYWTGATDQSFTNPNNWSDSHYPDQSGDAAIFDVKTGSNAPVLPSGTSTTLPSMQITSGCDYDITVNGSARLRSAAIPSSSRGRDAYQVH